MSLRVLFVALVALAFPAVVSQAIVNIYAPTGNTSAPTGTGGEPSDPGWDSTGTVKNSSAVYLGDGWVLTASHVGAGTYTSSNGTSYAWDGVTSHNIAGTDLTLFKLAETQDLPAATLAQSAPTVGSEVVMIGNGRSPTSDSSTLYYVDTDTDPYTWSTSPFAGWDQTARGYLTNSTRALRWGTNTIEAYGNDVGGIGYYFYTDFDLTGGTTYEAQAVAYDSGGPVFYYDGSQWVLAGLMVTVAVYSGQPYTSDGILSAFGGNLTYMVDISKYAEEINGLIPEPARYAVLAGLLAVLVIPRLRRRLRGSAAA